MTVRLPSKRLENSPEGRANQHREIVDALGALASQSGAGAGTGTVTTTGSPVSGNLTKFSGATSITNADLTGDVTTSGSSATTIGAGKVTLAMQANMATASVIYRKTAGAGAPEVQTLATLKTDLGLSGTNTGDQTTVSGNAGSATVLATGRTLAITGDLTWTSPSFDGSGNVTAAGTIPNNTVTYAKMQDVSATKRIVGRNTAGSGDPEEVTVEQVFSWISGTPAQGDIFYRDSSQVARLAAGTSGQVLQTQGSGANPQWVTPGLIRIDEQSPSGTGVVTFNSIAATYRDLVIVVRGRGTNASTSVNVRMTFNNDTAGNYDRQRLTGNNATASAAASMAQAFIDTGDIAANSATASVASGQTIEVLDYRGTTFQKVAHSTSAHKVGTTTADVVMEVRSGFWRSTSAITRVDLTLSAGNWASGSVVSLYGRM